VGTVPGSGAAACRAARASVADLPTHPGEPSAVLAEAVRSANQASAGIGGATTLVLALIAPDGTVGAARVGDSTVFHLQAAGTWRELFGAPDGEAVGTYTAALPADGPVGEFASAELAPGDVLVLMTDGVADPWRDGPSTVAPVLASGILERPSALELGRLADFSRQGCHDDRTIVCVWVSGGSEG
jgi:serine/threonine protein phosphatase PrpC